MTPSAPPGDDPRDPLLHRARDALRRQQAARDGASAPPRTDQGAIAALIQRVIDALAAAKRFLLRPFTFLRALGGGAFAQRVGRAFAWCAYARENGAYRLDAQGRRIISGARLLKCGVAALATVLALYLGVVAAYFYGTQFEEIVYTTGKQEIETGELYQFTGCTSLPCNTEEDNGKFYKIESSLFLPMLLYPEQDVYANIPQQNAACHAKGYGFYFRSLRWLYKYAQWYQKVYDVSCRPYTDSEQARAVGTGVIEE